MSLPICQCDTCGCWSDICQCDLRHRQWNLTKQKPIKKKDSPEAREAFLIKQTMKKGNYEC